MSNAPVDNQAHPLESEHGRSLWKLAKTAELKKHTLALQLQTAHIIASQNALDVRKSTLEDVKAQRNWLESERLGLLKQLEMVVADRDKAIELERNMQKECDDFANRVTMITEGEYSAAKARVDAIRSELDLPPARTLQAVLDEKSAAYLQERRLASQKQNPEESSSAKFKFTEPHPPSSAAASSSHRKRSADDTPDAEDDSGPSKKRGRPKGSKNKTRGGRD